MKLTNELAKKEIKSHAIGNYQKIPVKSGKILWNFRCQLNAVHEALNNNEDRIAMTMYFDGDLPIIHFLNVNKDGEFIDNTLGRWSETYDYYLIKFINKEDFFDIDSFFTAHRKTVRDRLPFFIRLFSDYAA